MYGEIDYTYSSKSKKGEVEGTVKSLDEFFIALDKIAELHDTRTDVSFALKKFGKDRIAGICPKSFPIPPNLLQQFELVKLCTGGQNGTDLCHLPKSGGLLDQDNVFVQVLQIYSSEQGRIFSEEYYKHEQEMKQNAPHR